MSDFKPDLEEKLKLQGYEPVNVVKSEGVIQELHEATLHLAKKEYRDYFIIPLQILLDQKQLKSLEDVSDIFVSYAKKDRIYEKNFSYNSILCEDKDGKHKFYQILDKD